jgi:alpha-tubulin suppressor-like RCC1 family protein
VYLILAALIALTALAPLASPVSAQPEQPAAPVAITAGDEFTCVLTLIGGVLCWGSNHSGQLGSGAPDLFRTTPIQVAGLERGVRAIDAGGRHACALRSDGGVQCWGYNGAGQLGDGTADSRATPVSALLSSPAVALSAGYLHTCAALANGEVACWGDNSKGQLGDGTTNTSLVPVIVRDLPGRIVALAAGQEETCALTAGGQIVCWGAEKPLAVRVERDATVIAGTNYHFCALLAAGQVQCWGANWAGQLGDGTTSVSDWPMAVQGLPKRAAALALEVDRSYALLEDGSVWWWGFAGGLQADGSNADKLTPVAQTGLPGPAAAVAAGSGHACVLLRTGVAMCWGGNHTGQLGDGTNIGRDTPVPVVGLLPMPARDTAAAFRRLWDQYDLPVATQRSGRSWTWGPPVGAAELESGIIREPFADLAGGTHEVVYFEKSRMEVNDPAADPTTPWYITNGLLPVELITGRVQTGYTSFEARGPATIAALGDPESWPTYADLRAVYQSPGALNPDDLGKPATGLLNPDGTLSGFNDYAGDMATILVQGANNHGVARAFADFMNQEGVVFEAGRYTTRQLYDPLFVFGLPITGAYWAKTRVGGKEMPILFQVFERRVLTYNPANPPAFRVEMGNVGQHYYRWRYGQ